MADQKLLEKSNLYAKNHNIDPYNIYAGIDVQAKDVQTPVKWNLLEKGNQATQTSIGLYAASATYTNASNWDDFQNRESAFWVNQKQTLVKLITLLMNHGQDFPNMFWKNQQ